MNDDSQKQITRLQHFITRLTLASQAQIIAGEHARRHSNLQAEIVYLTTTTGAIRANTFAEKPSPSAIQTICQALFGITNPTTAMARFAKSGTSQAMLARAITGGTSCATLVMDGFATTAYRLGKGDFQIEANIGRPRRFPDLRFRLHHRLISRHIIIRL